MPINKAISKQSTESLSENSKSSPINQWSALNGVLRTYKLAGLFLTGVCVLLSVGLIMIAYRPPLVVIKDQKDIYRSLGNYQEVEINELEIKSFVKRFIYLRYQWDELDPSTIAKNMEPITTAGANKKIKQFLELLKSRDFKDKGIQQDITNIKVKITKEKVIASFDKIIRITDEKLSLSGIPLIVPTLIYLNIIQDSVTHWNPIGLYVNGVIEKQIN